MKKGRTRQPAPSLGEDYRASASADSSFHPRGMEWGSQHFRISEHPNAERESTENLEEAIAHLQDHYQKANPGELTANLQAVDQMLPKNFTEITQWAHAIQERGQEEHLQCDYRILRTDTSNSLRASPWSPWKSS
ncbi:MAG: hypothetical protein R3B83_04020 [Nitrospirales bacterium]|nr:hypothetical protein [Nitrospirales bacterium]